MVTPTSSLLKLPRGWYWHITVTSGPDVHIGLYLKRKVLGLFRWAIEDHGYDYMILKAGQEFDADRSQQLLSMSIKIYETRFDQFGVMMKCKSLFPHAKVTKR